MSVHEHWSNYNNYLSSSVIFSIFIKSTFDTISNLYKKYITDILPLMFFGIASFVSYFNFSICVFNSFSAEKENSKIFAFINSINGYNNINGTILILTFNF